ncbi:AAA domain (dynein-related subfamily) domain-containing protein [Phthorimaea operculella]|nr:AAA domain (dynein-related subfamily) domain-containing protein [Phthorimaea operculella]
MGCNSIGWAVKELKRECGVHDEELRRDCDRILDGFKKETLSLSEAIQILSGHILTLKYAKLFRKYLSSVLLILVSNKIPLKAVFSEANVDKCSDSEKLDHLEYSITLALMSDHPDVLQYALKYLEINPIPPYEVFIHFQDSHNMAPKKRRFTNHRQKITESDIVECCYMLLQKLPNELSSKWDWTDFVSSFGGHSDLRIKWMVKECMAILTNMTEAQCKALSEILGISKEDNVDCINKFKTDHIQPYEGEMGDLVHFSTDKIVNIDGIMLPVYETSNVLPGNLVPVKSTMSNLRSLALAVASGNAVSLMGPVGSGKTSLVEHLAAITGRKGVAFKKVQLGDQTDSRMLLGSHQCTDIPGEFVWMPGVLTEAVQNGHWLLLEDIDCAALDVASTLSSLLERNALCVPGYRDSLPVTPGFQLFVTQRTVVTNYGFQKKLSNSSTLLQKHLTEINVEPLSKSELGEIIQKVYPSLTTICSKMLEVFMMFSVGSHETSLESTEESSKEKINLIRGSRLISTRDLMKWCSRAVVGFNVSSPESALKVLQDALDIFTCSVASPDDRLQLAKKIGTCLGIVETKSEFYCKHYKPNVALTPTALEVGRAKVLRKEKDLKSVDFDTKQVVFSFTRQSACLLERISCCVTSNEPVLLVGETGTGKTSSVQYLARQTGHKLVVINMNQQSDSADLLGGYKPVDLKYVIKPIRTEFEELFKKFYNVEKNQKFLGHIETCYETENWTALMTLMKQSYKAAILRLTNEQKEHKLKKWLAFGHKLTKLDQQVKAASRLTFAFIEGSLVKAMQEGHWVLLDEINLASAEILECLAGLLEDKNESIDLLEKGDKMPIKRHPDFTLFACMNPATDVGKKDLPVGLRNRFTEFFVDELTERNDLMLLIGDYLYHMNLSGAMLEAIFSFYATIRKEAKLSLVDGAGNAPHYSLRTLCRALTAAAKAKCGTVSRSLYEAFCLSFLTQLDSSSHPKVEAMIAKAVIGKKNIKSVLNQIIPEPQVRGQNYLLFEGHWIPQGHLDIAIPDGYILTPTVRKNLRDIARIISLGRLPVLLQGDTSVGKTSLITYIAKASGNYCVRINNHEHTDLQEYIGSYATDASGKLVFKEGVLVEAMRKGYWIILDELNLAPSDVLEALNRVLDDNRELFIPETQQVIKADPNFMLFATQNPPGLYGGRKMLSRAFRNRFVELHFDEIPRKELETILHERCHVPPAYSKKMIAVMAELQVRRRGSAAVQGKDGFITLRDLFRWGERYKRASKEMLTEDKFYDWDQHIADEGYLILAGKVRQTDERSIIEEVIEKHIKRKVNPDNLFSLHQLTSPVTKSILETILNNQLMEFSHVVWTYNMRRLAVLIAKAFIFDEPVLLVGETGCGKTTICQVLAALKGRQLLSVNCHMHTESSDFIGGLRPVRQYKNDGRLFEWADGPLIKAMESGDMFLADEISLADDSVLERLNSLLEPERQLLLAERGLEENSDIVVITADKNFNFIGTMNPGGDFGKKELSPALRNRFTEIWCDSVTSREDLLKVLEKSVAKGISLGNQEDGSSGIGNSILDFTNWLKSSEVTNKFPFSIRDLLSWVHFINITVNKGLLDAPEAYVHGACMIFLDCFGTALTGHIESETLFLVRKTAINFLLDQIKTIGNEYTESLRNMLSEKQTKFTAESDETKFGIKPFFIEVGNNTYMTEERQKFTFTAPTTGSNTLRLLRGLQLNKAILLEGNPGVGKTSLVTALAKSSGHRVVRINLSDQTDITDLFGTDLPTEDGSFTFKEGAFLTALQNGDWILLDELNLAPQPVLEGLNACLDHRGEIFIPELGRTFKVKEQTRLFACQNPLKQGGARRGLPVSFLNRFTQVYIDTLTKEDLIYIVESQYSSLPKDILHKIVDFNCRVAHEISEIQSWAHRGAPWEMNLRDIQRWCEALIEDQKTQNRLSPGKFVDMLYINRMRTEEDKEKMAKTYDEIFCPEYPRSDVTPQFDINYKEIVIGDVVMERNMEKTFKNRRAIKSNLLVLRNQLPTLKALAQNVKMNWLSILVGPTATGKSSIVQLLADLTGHDLQVIPVTSAMDVSDLLGGFEQVDYNRNCENLYDKIETLTIQTVRDQWLSDDTKKALSNKLFTHLYKYKSLQSHFSNKDSNEAEMFTKRIQFLMMHCEMLLEHNKTFDAIWNKVKEIVCELTKLQSKMSKATSVNAGGKFEWVDSLLVKTMIEGSWLLLDNVNLTSAAVLDRLNGLLEPNGVLSIPERGEMSEIKPHPNFRVFFTMDPKYGEISRAMRNRGVEIFLLRPDDYNSSLKETVTYMDLAGLLSSCGLPNYLHHVSIHCHDLMASFIKGYDRPTISHLLQAAHLTWQQILRGIPVSKALINSFSDVYIKPRSGGDFTSDVKTSLAEMKNNMLKNLKEDLISYKLDTMAPIDNSHTLTVKGLSNDSTHETIKQLMHPFKQLLVYNKEEVMRELALNLFTVIQKCPQENWAVLTKLIKHSEVTDDKSPTKKQLISELTKAADQCLEAWKGNCRSHQRFYPEQYALDDEIVHSSNAVAILLFHELEKVYTNYERPPKLEKSLTVLEYSKAVASGTLTDEFDEYPILKNCEMYIHVIDKYIKHSLEHAKAWDDGTVCNIMQMLNWRRRFVHACSLEIYTHQGKKKTFHIEKIVPLLNIHSKWLQKFLMTELIKSIRNTKLESDYNKELAKVIQTEANENAERAKLCKKLRKMFGQPKLCRNQEEYNRCVSRSEIYKKINTDMNQPLEKQIGKLFVDIATVTDWSLALDVPSMEGLKTIQDHIAQVSETPRIATKAMDIQILPIHSYIFQRIANLLQDQLYTTISICMFYSVETDAKVDVQKQISGEGFATWSKSLIHLGEKCRGIPPSLLNILQMLPELHQCSLQSISSLHVRYWDEFYKAMVNAPASYPLPFLNISKDSNEETAVVPMNSKRLSTNLPLMPYYIQKLTVSEGIEGSRHLLAYETVSLSNRAEYSMRLGTVLNIMWKNLGVLDTAAVTKLKSDVLFEIAKYEMLIDKLHCIKTPEGLREVNIHNVYNSAVTFLHRHFHDDPETLEMLDKASHVYKVLFNLKIDECDRLEVKILTAELSVYTSLILSKIMSELSPLDHVEKYKLKASCLEDDIEMFDGLLSAYYMHGLVSGTITSHANVETSVEVKTRELHASENVLKKVHPYVDVLLELKEGTMDKHAKYYDVVEKTPFRPETPTYGSFVKDCKHFTNSVLNAQTLKKVYSSLISTCKILQENFKTHSCSKCVIQNAQTVLKETESWLYSVNAFYKKVESTYSDAFPDLAKPLQSSLSQTVFSITALKDLIKELIVKIERGPLLAVMVKDLMEYPNSIEQDKVKHLNRFLNVNFMKMLSGNADAWDDDAFNAKVESLEVLKMNLAELRMHCTAKERVDATTTQAMLTTLQALVKVWEQQQRDIEKKKQDDEALYVTKSKCEDEDDDVIAQQEIKEMFPSYTEEDFGEFKPPDLDQKPVKNTQIKPKSKYLINPEDVTLVYKWHSNFMKYLTSAEWLAKPKKLVGNDVISPFLQRYPIFSRVIQDGWEALDAELEGTMTPGLLVLISQIKEKIDGEESSSTKADFYRSPWVSQTRQCVPLLHRVKDTTNELLDQWPDFPTLKDIMVIVNRILSFSVTSPVSRFLTGLELLRDKIEEWNKNAHKGNNMIEVSLAVGQQIINWRKLEMGHWKECLNNLYHRKQSEAHKYWFYLFSVVASYLETPEGNDPVTADRVISVLKDFIETSNLAEFDVRLDIVYVYHCHMVHLEASQRRDELLSIFWNTYNYYSQFAPQVATYIKDKRAPIEKKLRDFVKICTWDRDLSYWSVKDTVEKAHKALHKHTKEFETVLKESVANCLVDKTTEAAADHVGIWDRPKRSASANAPAGGAYMIDPLNYVVLARNIKKYLDQAEEPNALVTEGSLLSKVPTLLNKAKTLCKDTITNSGYPSLVQGLDDFVTMVIETSSHLGSLEVDTTLPKEKQTSQAKNIVQQKRKALADLFKYLAKMGLNYRTGLVILSANDNLYDFTIPPVDLDAAIGNLKNRRCDASLSLLWSGCEKYFQKSIARHRLLTAGLQQPHQDLGIQNIERCKGFAAQLMKLTNSQKRSISKYSRFLCDLRALTTNFTNALDTDIDGSISTLDQTIDTLIECYANVNILLDQFSIVLKSCPEKGMGDNEPQFDADFSDSPIVKCFKNSEEWTELYAKVKAMISTVNKQKTALLKLSATPKVIGKNIDSPVISPNHTEVMYDAIEALETLKTDADAILKEYEFKFKITFFKNESFEPRHPLLNSIINLSKYLEDNIEQLKKETEVDAPMDDNSTDLIKGAEDLTATMLLIIQSIYKKHLPEEKSTDNVDVLNAIDEIIDEPKEREEAKEILEDRHLKELLQEKLSIDCKYLQLDSLIEKLNGLLKSYISYMQIPTVTTYEVPQAMMRLVPILEQTVLFVQYFVTQKVAVHRVSCKMLSVLLKIFSDLATKGFCKPSDLDMEEGDGDGGPGKLSGGTGLGEGEGQKDVSEQIENQVHGDNSDEEDENDDADKQMGDIDNAAEKLDQQIWGEDEEDVQDEGKKEKEEKGKGESTGEKEMGAKDEEQGQDDGSEGKEKKQKKDINEMDEPEVDDDHVDPYHGNQQQLPEPEDFEMPDNMDVDGEDGDDNEGETETENPFEITANDIPEEKEEEGEQKEENKNGLEVSSDEEDGGEDKGGDEKEEEKEGEQEQDGANAEPDTEDKPEPEQEENPEGEEDQDLPKNPEDITEEDEVQEKAQDANPQANPSSNDPSAGEKAENAEMNQGADDNVDTNEDQQKDEDAAPYEQAQEQVGEDKQSTGRSELDKSDKGHRGEKQAARAEQSREQQQRHENKPGRTDHERTLGDVNEKKHKQSKTLNVEKDDQTEDGGDNDDEAEKEADAYQHVKQAKKDDLQAVDAATKEQADQQPTLQQDEEEAEKLKEDEEVPMEVDDDELQMEKSEELKPEKVKDGGLDKEKDKSGNKKDSGEEPTGETGIEVEGETVLTANVPRGLETSYHTRLEDAPQPVEEMSIDSYMSIREWLTSGPLPNSTTTSVWRSLWQQCGGQARALCERLRLVLEPTGRSRRAGFYVPNSTTTSVWRSLWQQCGGQARALCERLRLVLEPTGRSRRAGDFRTGRAINMRRVIPYIASHFRKDRIWLRRTKPAKREYKIAIAIDDSSSMSDNRSKELAFESLALVSQALNLLESGDLAVLSFGEKPNLLHPFTEQFSEHSGSKILEQLQFSQTKTKIAQLLDFCSVMFEQQAIRSDAVNAKLLVIVSDGRGIFSEGETRVIQAVRRARQAGVFLVYVIIDNPDNKDSIMDIRRPIMDPTSNSVSFVPYLDTFPFPFYLILRDMSALPMVLGDALRQWFEIATNTAS